MRTVGQTFTEGLIVVTPLLIPIAAFWWSYSVLSSVFFIDFIEPSIIRVTVVLGLMLCCVLFSGYLMRTAIGRTVDQVVHNLINKFPFIRVLYNAVRTTLDMFLSQSEKGPEPIKIEVWNGHRMAAFDTGRRTSDGHVVAFIPGSPEVTSGFVVEADPNSVLESDEESTDVLVRLLSAGFGDEEETKIQG